MRLEDANASDRTSSAGSENILKFLLNFFYKLIPNYGVAIILVTILIKVIFFPLTKKGSISTARMQELQPKIQELQAKYKSNPQKLNQEMAEFYKRENYNPMSGCLPHADPVPPLHRHVQSFQQSFRSERREALSPAGFPTFPSLKASSISAHSSSRSSVGAI